MLDTVGIGSLYVNVAYVVSYVAPSFDIWYLHAALGIGSPSGTGMGGVSHRTAT